MLKRIINYFKPDLPIKRISEEKIPKMYKQNRWKVLEASFIGYAAFYLVRNNLSTVAKEMGSVLHYDYSMIGDILAISAISYGLGKFLMGALSDRSNPRKFMAFGLLLSAILNFTFGASASFPVHLFL